MSLTTLLKGAVSQYVDSSGKTRMITFNHNGEMLSLMTSPLPPIPNLKTDKTIRLVPLIKALNFIKEKGFQITEQDGSEAGIRGVWLETKEQTNGIYYAYIPVKFNKPPIKDVPFNTKSAPLRVNTQSELMEFRRNRKIAEILKQYVLYTYAHYPDDFGENYFVIIQNHHYDIEKLNKRMFIDGNDIMYENGYLIVPSEIVRDKLLAYLKVSLLNDKQGVMNLKNKTIVENYYSTVSDFRNIPDQLVFVNRNGLLRWKKEQDRNQYSDYGSTNDYEISSMLLPTSSEPYFYKNLHIRKDLLMLVQNVHNGEWEAAVMVALKWKQNHINIGYKPTNDDDIDISTIPYILYTEMGELEKDDKTPSPVHIIQYDDGTYAALLFFV
jgi:hypothetical protein